MLRQASDTGPGEQDATPYKPPVRNASLQRDCRSAVSLPTAAAGASVHIANDCEAIEMRLIGALFRPGESHGVSTQSRLRRVALAFQVPAVNRCAFQLCRRSPTGIELEGYGPDFPAFYPQGVAVAYDGHLQIMSADSTNQPG